jgi:hypothetical protein
VFFAVTDCVKREVAVKSGHILLRRVKKQNFVYARRLELSFASAKLGDVGVANRAS